MLPNSNNSFDKSLKMMTISAIVLIVLFGYTLYESNVILNSFQYYMGLLFLIILLVLSVGLRFYKDKIQAFILNKKGDFSRTATFAHYASDNNMPSKRSLKKETYIESINPIKTNVKFKDVAGIVCVKEELEEIVHFLNEPKRYLQHGIKLPKGVLLVGPPGVGKTLIAQAVATEANVPFFYQSGASFVHIYVGMGAKRVRELFLKAKASSPAIIFIDEIDAVGQHRKASNEEREGTLNELLTQMDGFEGDNGVLVIAATNKIEVLDEALLRPGRFDRRLFLTLPNIQDRKEILELYLKDKTYDFDLEKLINDTAGFSSAGLKTLINEALLHMIKQDRYTLSQTDIQYARTKVEFGKKEPNILEEEQKEILAIYQACKAFILKKELSLFDEHLKIGTELYPSKSKLLSDIKGYLSGFIGVEVMKQESYAIGSHDLQTASRLASDMVHQYGMNEDENRLLDNVKRELRKEFYTHSDAIVKLKDILLKNEVITEHDLNGI